MLLLQHNLWTEQIIPTVWRGLSCTEDGAKKKAAIIYHSQAKNVMLSQL